VPLPLLIDVLHIAGVGGASNMVVDNEGPWSQKVPIHWENMLISHFNQWKSWTA